MRIVLSAKQMLWIAINNKVIQQSLQTVVTAVRIGCFQSI